MPTKPNRLVAAESRLSNSADQQAPLPSPSRPPVTNVILLGARLADAFGPAQVLLNRTPSSPADLVENLRQWYYRQHPADRTRLLWQRFIDAEQMCDGLESAVQATREAIDVERDTLAQAEAERAALVDQPLPVTVGQEAARPRADVILRYEALQLECQQRQAALSEMERLVTEPERVWQP